MYDFNVFVVIFTLHFNIENVQKSLQKHFDGNNRNLEVITIWNSTLSIKTHFVAQNMQKNVLPFIF